jgi:hypothetical protein
MGQRDVWDRDRARARRQMRPGALVAGFLVAAALLAGCGSSDSGSADKNTTTTSTTAKVTTTTAASTSSGPNTTMSTAPTTAGGATTTAPSNGLHPGDPCSLEEGSADCIDPEGDGTGVYLIGGADCIATLPDPALCADLDGDGHAGYPDAG